MKSYVKIPRWVVFDSMGKDHDVVGFADLTSDRGTVIVRFSDDTNRTVAVFVDPISYSQVV
jgi:hypothetical protein